MHGALAVVCGTLLFAPCDVYAPPMGGPYEEQACTAGVVEVGPGRFSHDIMQFGTVITVELDTAQATYPACT